MTTSRKTVFAGSTHRPEVNNEDSPSCEYEIIDDNEKHDAVHEQSYNKFKKHSPALAVTIGFFVKLPVSYFGATGAIILFSIYQGRELTETEVASFALVWNIFIFGLLRAIVFMVFNATSDITGNHCENLKSRLEMLFMCTVVGAVIGQTMTDFVLGKKEEMILNVAVLGVALLLLWVLMWLINRNEKSEINERVQHKISLSEEQLLSHPPLLLV